MTRDHPAPELDAHRLLGDGTMAALLRPDSTIDWWCGPAFDDEPLLWSLLDPGGAFARYSNAVPIEVPRRAAGPLLETLVRIDGHAIDLRDGLLVLDGTPALVRLARCDDTSLDLEHELSLGGFERLARSRWDGTVAQFGPFEVHVTSNGAAHPSPSDASVLVSRMQAPAGSWASLVISLGAPVTHRPDALLEVLLDAERRRDADLDQAHLPAPHRDRCADALAVLAACTYEPTGAPVAAPTTSLPEAPGADRQFDYRASWLRDSSLALAIAAELRADRLAHPYVQFLRTIGPDALLDAPVRTIRGGDVPAERIVPGIAGWLGSTPIRVGNDAAGQVQYDALGFVVDALAAAHRHTRRLRSTDRRMVRTIADACCDEPHQPSSGIWELREPADLVCADIGRWTALDRAIRIEGHRRPRHARRWRRARRAARWRMLDALTPDGFLPQTYGGTTPDASGLLLVILGVLRPGDPRADRLVDRTTADLGTGAFLHRYPPGPDDGFDGFEGAFVPVSWWRVTALAQLGRIDDADRIANDLCATLPQLLPEEWRHGRATGNTPLLWSHMETARALTALDTDHQHRRRRRLAAAMRTRLYHLARMVASAARHGHPAVRPSR